MEKTLLRSVIVGLTAGQEIDITFRGALQGQTGSYRVLETKRGRGKGGSQLAVLEPVDGGDSVTIGTPSNDDILNVTVEGAMFGYRSETEVPANYETNAGRAVQLKEQFKTILDAAEQRPVVEITAPQAPEVNGIFTVVDARQLRGRGGQIVLTLQGENDASTVEAWSYRHSGVIETFTILSD